MGDATSTKAENTVLPAMQLGWLVVEVYGLIHRYNKSPARKKNKVEGQFSFSHNDPTLRERLEVALKQLKAIAAHLIPDLPPPLPDDLEQISPETGPNIDAFWKQFDDWSRRVSIHLQVSDARAGQAFTCGGQLADTFWFAQGADDDKLIQALAKTLCSYRLEYLVERTNDLAGFLPEFMPQAASYTLLKWSIGEMVKGRDAAFHKRLLVRLEAQAKVWRDLLFGVRRASSYLTWRDRRKITWGSLAATAGLALLVGMGVWLVVLLLAGLGRSLMELRVGAEPQVAEISETALTYLSNWENWSSLLAVISSVGVVLLGFISRVSGWIITFHHWFKSEWELRQICYRTYRAWIFQGRRKKEGKKTEDSDGEESEGQ